MKQTRSLLCKIVLLAALLMAVPISALAAPSAEGCTGRMSPKGQHHWYSRAQDPWCETSGGLLWKCRYCDKQVFEETEAALDHLWGDWKTEYPGTCVQQGMNVRVCSRCGREDYVYSGFGGHDWGE